MRQVGVDMRQGGVNMRQGGVELNWCHPETPEVYRSQLDSAQLQELLLVHSQH